MKMMLRGFAPGSFGRARSWAKVVQQDRPKSRLRREVRFNIARMSATLNPRRQNGSFDSRNSRDAGRGENKIVRARSSRQALRPMMQKVNLGMIGGGTVGSGVFRALQRNGALLSSRIGVKVNLHKIAVKAYDEPRPYEIP